MVATILQVREYSCIFSYYFASDARTEPIGARACPSLITPLTFEGIRDRGQGKKYFYRVLERDPRKKIGFLGEKS